MIEMGLRKIRMKTTSAGPNGCYAPGQEVVVDEERAGLLVSGGYAEYMDTPAKEPVIEAATAEPPENAARPPANRRKAGR